MKHLSRIAGLLAAVALALGMAVGIAAQGSDSVEISVELQGEAVCEMSFMSAGSFGTWTWNGTGYAFVEGSDGWSGEPTVYVYGDFHSQPEDGCNITVAFDGLSNGTGGTIGTENFSAYSAWTFEGIDPAGWNHAGVIGWMDGMYLTYDWQYTLESVPTDLEEGDYSGNIEVTFSNAQ